MKFSFRDLFLVTVIVALVLGWRVDKSRMVEEAERRKEHQREYKMVLEAAKLWERQQAARQAASSSVPNSSAPAPNPPRP